MPEPMTLEDVLAEFSYRIGTTYGVPVDLKDIPMRTEHDVNKMADEILRLRATLAQRREEVSAVEVEALQEVIMWALGERDDFPERPERVDGKPYPFYWWRTEMRRRYTAALAASGEGA